jgi:cellulose biosynthesis protein BcsQ
MRVQEPKPKGRIVTFYSYKGGTGRSMLLANVAWVLASNGHRVLMVDWDLEAPGLHRYFHPFLKDKTLCATDGLIDAITSFVEEAVSLSAVDAEEPLSDEENSPPNTNSPPQSSQAADPSPQSSALEGQENPDWYIDYANLNRYAVPLDWKFPNGGHLDHLGPGRQGPSYATRVNLFDWEAFYGRFAGAAFLEAAKRFMQEAYDYILIDSRTGVSDTSGICTIQMPDLLVVCFTLNNQSIEGASTVAAGAVGVRAHSPTLPPLTVFPVPTRVEIYGSPWLELGRELAHVRFGRFVSTSSNDVEVSERERQQYWGSVEVPYIPKYAFEEVLATFSDQPHVRISVLAPTEQVASLIRGRPTELVPPSEQQRSAVLLQFARKPYIVTVAEEFVSKLSTAEQESARRLFTRLVQVSPTRSPTTPDVSSRCSLDMLSKDAIAMLDRAVAEKLMRRVAARDGSTEKVELSDERLITTWPRLSEWLNAQRDFLHWRQQLDQLLETWLLSERNPDDLLTGTVLNEASKWSFSAAATELSEKERDFIRASQAADESVRQLAVEANATRAVARRVSQGEWEERQRLERRTRELEAVVAKHERSSAGFPFRLVLFVLACTALIGGMIFLFMRYMQSGKMPGKGTQQAVQTAQTSAVDQRLQEEARRQLANILVALGIASYDQALKLDPADGVLAIDRKIEEEKKSKAPTGLEVLESQRIQYLRNSEPLFDSSPVLVKYVCAHNFFLVAASEESYQAADRFRYWKKRFPRAELGPAPANNPNWVPVIVDFFLTCADAKREAALIQKRYGPKYGNVPANGWFALPGCSRCAAALDSANPRVLQSTPRY